MALGSAQVGATNVLKYLNHACQPNARMAFFFLGTCWHALLLALDTIEAGDEVRFDYGLVTEDEEDPGLGVVCRCGSEGCRGTLFQLRRW